MIKSGFHQALAVRVQLGYPRTIGRIEPGESPIHARIEIEDKASGIVILQLELGPADFLNLMGGSGAYVTAHLPKTEFLGRLGKEMLVDTVNLGPTHEMTEAAAKAAGAALAEGDWDAVSVNKTRDGWQATLRRWVAPEEAYPATD